ncbi:MAG TPA: molybdenum cofactor biosynthesis protein MoaE [Gemmatimonadaceae bacterium]|nr:molybdenum cofactor biosynthesis protein MoaE [Gemmatimonadaceae bacterium]
MALTHDPIHAQELIDAVASHSCGAISLFLGTVRDVNDGRAVTGIEYSAYVAMAEREMRSIVDEATQRFPGVRLALLHRVGRLELGEVSVGIAAAHPHRTPALDAARYTIEELKRRVPIWKREQYTDGTREWVDPTARRAEVAL